MSIVETIQVVLLVMGAVLAVAVVMIVTQIIDLVKTMANSRYVRDVISYTKREFEEVDVVGGEARFNHKCHMNVTHHALKNGDPSVVMVIMIEDETSAIIHFVNWDGETYVDNTLGMLGQTSSRVRHYKVCEFKDFETPDRMLLDGRRFMRNRLGPSLAQKLSTTEL